ncbi:hypothetical protein CC80DRAFT_572610 [Byssothecium circinans]|uniref:Uncharacterized protein n=1 Tax=Byssothecium circinans TaxID=147558 RepID=A0A6A5TL08_9PLEO|nr:hypothetical protein CC80DRAFT_572610 [Byssothecium circinans]
MASSSASGNLLSRVVSPRPAAVQAILDRMPSSKSPPTSQDDFDTLDGVFAKVKNANDTLRAENTNLQTDLATIVDEYKEMERAIRTQQGREKEASKRFSYDVILAEQILAENLSYDASKNLEDLQIKIRHIAELTILRCEVVRELLENAIAPAARRIITLPQVPMTVNDREAQYAKQVAIIQRARGILGMFARQSSVLTTEAAAAAGTSTIRQLFSPQNALSAIDRVRNSDVDAAVLETMMTKDNAPAEPTEITTAGDIDPLAHLCFKFDPEWHLDLEVNVRYYIREIHAAIDTEKNRLNERVDLTQEDISLLTTPRVMNYMIHSAVWRKEGFRPVRNPIPSPVLSNMLGRTLEEFEHKTEVHPRFKNLLQKTKAEVVAKMREWSPQTITAQKALLKKSYHLSVDDINLLTDTVLKATFIRATETNRISDVNKEPLPKDIVELVLGKSIKFRNPKTTNAKRTNQGSDEGSAAKKRK